MKKRTKRLLILEGAFALVMILIHVILWWGYGGDYAKDVLIQDAPKTAYRFDDQPVKTRACLSQERKQDLIQKAMREWVEEWNQKEASNVQ